MNKREVWEIQYDVAIAAAIIDARIKKGRSQKWLARKIGTKQPAIARAEAGNIPVSHALLKRIAKALDVKLLPPSLEL